MALSTLRIINTRSLSRTITVPSRHLSRRLLLETTDPHSPFRTFYTFSENSAANSSKSWKLIAGALLVSAFALAFSNSADAKEDTPATVDYVAVKREIENILDNDKYDDGSYAPVLVRLAWHAAGTFEKVNRTGGSAGATMRFHPESNHDANKGLEHARILLEKVKQKHPGISYADLWSLAGVVAIESMGGPKIVWRPGRSDKPDSTHCTPDGRLPDASKGASHVREIFSRMGFSDRETVALVGAHAVGRCHTDRSGYSGPWTNSPTVFSNDFFVQLLENKWTKKNGPVRNNSRTLRDN